MAIPGTPQPRYSAWSLLRARLAGAGYWRPLWAGRRLQEAYDVVVVGAGGHGLATAFHLARDHGVRRVAVLEKRLVGYGNVGPQHDHRPVELSAIPRTTTSTRTRCAAGKPCRAI